MSDVTIGVVNYNGMGVLPDTLKSIRALACPISEVIVVDNGSTDGSPEWIRQNYPEFRCIELGENIGLPGAQDLILREARTDLIFTMDNDISLEGDSIDKLVEVMKKVPNVGACHPEIRDESDPNVSHYNGGWIHYLCASVPRSADTGPRPEYEVFDAVSGAALLIDRNAALRIGGFDGDYFFNWGDGDFTTRLTLAGYLCLNIPKAIVHHRGKFRKTSTVFNHTRNRWFFILKLYSWRTILFVFPMLFIFEISQAMFMILKGTFKDYVRGNIAAVRMLPKTLKKRKDFMKIKIKKDKDWLRSGDIYFSPNLLNNSLAIYIKKAYCGLFDMYWNVISRFC
jgi:GT2 family glycosyltransferase